MVTSAAAELLPEVSQRPTSVFLHGVSRPLLNWVLYVMLVRSGPNFYWTDIRLPEEALDPLDPLARNVVPSHRLSVILPEDLRQSTPPESALASMIQPDEAPESVRKVAAFLRLPAHTQDLIARETKAGRISVFGLSNVHRSAALYSGESVRSTVRTIHESGASLIMTWADALPAGSRYFDFVIEVSGVRPKEWKESTLRCVHGDSTGPVRAGITLKLGNLAAVVDVLSPLGI